MMRPLYSTVFQNYPRRDLYPHGMLLELLGWNGLLNNEAYKDTCAMRVSYALACSGVRLPGAGMRAWGKRAKGWPIEPSQGKLSNILRVMWGAPEKYRGEDAARAGIGTQGGVVSFFRIHPGVNQGHIDLVMPRESEFSECASQCYFSSREVWFWTLK